MQDLCELLRNNPYPGRGIVVGKDCGGRHCAYYWIMGRSPNSRNRVFSLTADGIRTEAHDPALLKDASLIIYHPVRRMGDDLVVTNGDQTDTIVDAGDFFAACMAREFEPDDPNFTPRISAILHAGGSFELSILKRQAGASGRYLISTYQGDGDPLPSFVGEPMEVSLPTANELWVALNADNKVSLYANVGGTVKLYNKNLGD